MELFHFSLWRLCEVGQAKKIVADPRSSIQVHHYNHYIKLGHTIPGNVQ